MTVRRARCELCDIKMPKKQPKLRCSICCEFKHLKCQNLTKADANYLIYLKIDWTCHECLISILPVNGGLTAKRTKSAKIIGPKYKVQCSSCNGFSYTPRNVRTCEHCENQVHAKCWNHGLGCTSCCEAMIPGFHAYTYEILGDPYLKNDKLYNPYANNHFTQLIGDMFENSEADNSCQGISEILVNCKYKKPENAMKPNNGELSIFSLNVQSLPNKIAHLRDHIDFYKNFDALMFNETNCIVEKLPNKMDDILLDNFHEPIVKNPTRSSGRGGGLVIYINKRVCEDPVEDIEEFDPYSEPGNNSGEFQFIKLKNCKGHRKTAILGNVYRSPAPSNKAKNFNILFEKILQKLNTNRYANKIKYIVGDFNQDLIKHDSDDDCQNLIDIAHGNGFVQIVSRPTRITEHSATLIDHVYTNSIDSTLSCNILTLDLSDHLATHTKITLGTSTAQSRTLSAQSKSDKRNIRIFNEANDLKFKQLINEETWEEAISENLDAESAYNKFNDIYTKHYNSAYPLKSEHVRRKNERQNPKPWILPWLEDACARKNDLFHKFINEPTPENKTKYDKLSEFCAKHVDMAKAKYHKSYFEKYKENSRKQWQMINGLLNRNKKGKVNINKLVDANGGTLSKPEEISESFNNYFCNIASNLKEASNYSGDIGNNAYNEFLKSPVYNSMHLDDTDASEVYSIIKKFKNKATRDTKISALKIANESYVFTNALAGVINKSLQQGIFPSELKVARVTPIHKEGPRNDVSNYRPISLLTSFSKIYEKLMHIRILNFLESNNSLFEQQYGFRPARSCEHALLNAQNTLLESLNNRQISLLLLCDFSKAFDMVDHRILLKKLYHYGIRGPALNWLKSYLSNRKQFVSVNDMDSNTLDIAYGVPQGSILGPLLFVIYINDIPEIAGYAKFIIYADDANIIITAATIEEVYNQLLSLINNLVKWVNFNGLSLNLKKTKYMIFSRGQVELPSPLKIQQAPIERVVEARFLGVIIDESLKWSRHVKTILSKMSRYVGVMYKIKKLLPLKARLQVYHSFIQSHINYCSLVWGFSCKSNIEAIFSKQKKGLRAVIPGYINYFFRDGILPGHTKSAFNEYQILTVQNTIAFNALLIIERMRSFPSSLPPSIVSLIPTDSPAQNCKFDDNESWLQTYNTFLYRSSFYFKGPMLYCTSGIIENLNPDAFISLKKIRTKIRNSILEIQNEGGEDEWRPENFVLNNVKGLRSSMLRNTFARYTIFF